MYLNYNHKEITRSEIINIIKELPNDSLKNELSMQLMSLIPTEQRQVAPNRLNLKDLLNEFLKDESVILKQVEYGLAVDKYKLYDFFKPHGLTRTEVLKQLDNANLIFHREGCRTILVNYEGYPVRVVVIKE